MSGDSLRRFLSGAASGSVTACVLQPLDVIRTTQQSDLGRRSGVVATARWLAREQGALALFKGVDATFIRVFFGAGIYFTCLDVANRFVQGLAGGPNAASGETGSRTRTSSVASSGKPLSSFISGALARSIAATIMSPVSVVKTRLEYAARGSSGFKNPLHGVAVIARTEGMAGLFRGLLPTIMRDAPYSGIYFASYSACINRCVHSVARRHAGRSHHCTFCRPDDPPRPDTAVRAG